MVSTPSSNHIKLFSNLDDNGILYYANGAGDKLPVAEMYSPVKEVTYAELWQMWQGLNGTFATGSYYLITDFQTIYDQPDYYCDGKLKNSVQVVSATTKPILVMATSKDRLSPDAYQIGDYSKDKIKYDISWYLTEFNHDAKGRITETIDEWGNRTDYDHRDIKFRRYLEYLPDSNITTTGVIKEYDCVSGVVVGDATNFSILVPGDIILIDLSSYTLGLRVDQVVDNLNMKVVVDGNYMSGVPGPFQTVSSYTVTPTDYSFNGQSYTFSVGYQTGQWNRYKEVYMGQADYNEYDSFYTFKDLNVGSCTNNIIGDFSNEYNSNTSPIILANNVFGVQCHNNNIGGGSVNNTTSNNFSLNTIKRFIGNVITGNMLSNNIHSNFEDNYIHTVLWNNVNCHKFGNNNIYQMTGNKIECSGFSSNIINSFVYNNIIGGSFDFNNAFDFSYNTISGGGYISNTSINNFIYNTISVELTNVDFTSSTLVYGNYNCNIFKNQAGLLRLSYYDGTDVLLIVDITD
jgi:hypothetical protein